MKVEEAMLILLSERNGGMSAEQLAAAINSRRLHIRKDGQPVSTKQVWWVVKNFPDTFTYAEGRVFLVIYVDIAGCLQELDRIVLEQDKI